MYKKGQFFIFAAIVISLAVFAVTIQSNRIEERVLAEDFNDLSKNYATEVPKVINDAIKNSPDDPTVRQGMVDTFTDRFLKYARTIDPNLGMAYVYKDPSLPDKVIVKNALGETITISSKSTEATTLFSTNEKTINAISLNLGGQDFKQSV